MPCMDSGPSYSGVQERLSKVIYLMEEIMSGQHVDVYKYETQIHPQAIDSKEELDKRTAELCRMITNYYGKGEGDIRDASLEMRMWWRNHEMEDDKRMKEERDKDRDAQIRRKALAKLTDEERRVLKL